MLTARWSRLTSNRPRLKLIIGVALLIGALFVLAELSLTRSSMMARRQRAEATVEQLTRQQAELQQELTRAQQGQNIPPQAFEQFGMAPKGAGVIVGRGEKAPETVPTGDEAPFWVRWWKRLEERLGLP